MHISNRGKNVRLLVILSKKNLCLFFGHQVLSNVGWHLWQIMQIRFCRQFHMTDRLPNWQLAGVGSMLAGRVWLGWRQLKWRHPPGPSITSCWLTVFPLSLFFSTFLNPWNSNVLTSVRLKSMITWFIGNLSIRYFSSIIQNVFCELLRGNWSQKSKTALRAFLSLHSMHSTFAAEGGYFNFWCASALWEVGSVNFTPVAVCTTSPIHENCFISSGVPARSPPQQEQTFGPLNRSRLDAHVCHLWMEKDWITLHGNDLSGKFGVRNHVCHFIVLFPWKSLTYNILILYLISITNYRTSQVWHCVCLLLLHVKSLLSTLVV